MQLTTVNKWLKNFSLSCQNLYDQARSGGPERSRCRPFKTQIQMQRVAHREYQAHPTSHSPMWFVTFPTSAKAAELCFTQAKYCRIFFTYPCIIHQSQSLGYKRKNKLINKKRDVEAIKYSLKHPATSTITPLDRATFQLLNVFKSWMRPFTIHFAQRLTYDIIGNELKIQSRYYVHF